MQTRPSRNQLGPQSLVCAVCKRPSQTEGELFCPHDGAILIDPSELPNAQIDPLIGRRIESFAIVARLGEGGMGTVYRALQIGMDREVALKILRSDLAHDGKVVARFHQEARAAARLSHRNLATVYTSGSTSDGIYFIAMEHLDGPSLEQVIASAWQERDGVRTYTLDRPRVVRLWCQIVAALAHAHRLGIVHRDLRQRRKSRRSLRSLHPEKRARNDERSLFRCLHAASPTKTRCTRAPDRDHARHHCAAAELLHQERPRDHWAAWDWDGCFGSTQSETESAFLTDQRKAAVRRSSPRFRSTLPLAVPADCLSRAA